MRITEVGEQGDPELQSPGEGLSQAQERTTEKVGTKQVSGSLFSMGDPHPCESECQGAWGHVRAHDTLRVWTE